MNPRLNFVLQLARHPTQRRHIIRWIKSLQADYLLKYAKPWLVFDAIDYLQSLDLNGKCVFEYGSGGSTLYWLSRNMICVSVEHDLGWYESVRLHLDASMEVDYRLVQPEKSNSKVSFDIANPLLYLSGDTTFRGYSFKNYAYQIDAFPHDYFDVVLVDGRARPSCIMHSVTKVKVDGLLVLDNSGRDYYLERASSFLRNYDRITFRGATPGVSWFTETSVFTRKI